MRKQKEKAVAEEVDVFSIESMETDLELSPSILLSHRPPPSHSLLPQQRRTATLGPRRRVGEAKPTAGLRRPSPARSPIESTAPHPPLFSRVSPLLPTVGLPPRPLPSSGRIVRTVSSPSKLTTTEKRRQDEEEMKESTDSSILRADFTAPIPLRARPRAPLTASYRPLPSGAKRALSALTSLASKSQQKPLQVSRSSPLPSSPFDFASLESSESSTSSSLRFSTALTGADRHVMEELQYLLDGCSSSSPVEVRHSSAVKLVQSFHRAHTHRRSRGDGHPQFFLMRAHGGFDQLCGAFTDCGDDPLMMEAFIGCAYLMSKEQPNAQCVTVKGVETLLEAIQEKKQRKKKANDGSEMKEETADDKDEEEKEEKVGGFVPQLRSIRRQSTSQPKDSTAATEVVRALFSGEAVFTRTGQPYSVSLLALVALLSFSADGHFKATFSRIVGSFAVLTSLVHRTFCAMLATSQHSASTSSPLFLMQTLLTTLENLTYTHAENQRLLLQAKADPASVEGSEGSHLPFTIQGFPQLYFTMLQWCTHRVVHSLDQPETTEMKSEDGADQSEDNADSVDKTDRSHVALTTPTYTSLALLLCRLLVNLTNKSERGCQVMYYSYNDPVLCLTSSSPSAAKRKTGVQIIADLVGLCWYHPHLRSPAVPSSSSSSSLPSLNAESDLFDLLTLSLGVMINTAEQSAVIREVLLENTHLTLRRQEDGTLISITPEVSSVSLHTVETAHVTWVAAVVDIFANTYLTLLALAQQPDEDDQPRPSQPAVPLAEASAPPQRYGSRAHSAPIVPTTQGGPSSAASVAPTAPISSGEHASLIHRMICSYSAMLIAVLAVHDGLAFTKVQAALRGRAENAHVTHRPTKASPSNDRMDDTEYLYDPSPSPRERGWPSQSPSLGGAGEGGTGAEGKGGVQVIFSLRLVVRLLNEFLLLQHEGSMSEESLHSMQILILQLERRIKADSAFGV